MVQYNFKAPKTRNNTKVLKILVAIFAVIVIGMGIFLFSNYYNYSKANGVNIFDYPKELLLSDNYETVKLVGVDASGMVLGSQCKQLLIPITTDQAFSISNGVTRDFSRPLTHDLFKATLDHYGVKPVRFSIDKYENDLWYATIRFQKGLDVLDSDVRPSDGVAMAVRYNITINIDRSTFEKKAKNVC